MTKIIDLMNAIIEIFNDHAGEDKILSKEELMKMMNKGNKPKRQRFLQITYPFRKG